MINKIKYILSFGYVKLLVACILAGVFISSMLGIVYIASIGGDKTPVLARVSNQTITKKQLDSKMSDLDKLGITKLSREDVLSSMINCKIAGLEAIKFDFDANGNEINQSTDNALSTYYPDFDQDQKNIIRQDVKCEVLASKLKNVYLAFSGGSYLSINVPISYAADSGTSAPTYQQFLDQDKSAQELANKISQDLAAGTINVNDAASLIASNPANVNIDSKIKTDFTKNDFLSNNDIFSDGAIKDQVFSKIQNDIKIDSNVGKTDIGSATAGLVPSLGSDDETYQTASADIRQITPVVTNQIMHDTAGNISKQWLVISPSQYKEGGYQNVDDLQPDLYKTYQVSYRIDPKDDFKNNFNFINGQNLLSQQSTSSSAGSSDYTKVAGATSDCTLGKIKFEAPADRVKNNKIIAPAAVDFTVSGGTGVNYYHWSFGDPGSEPHASASGAKLTYRHLYNYGGNYTITLYGYDRVVKKDGKVVLNDCGTKTVTIDLNGPAAPDTRCNL
ncbi:MAG: hypothetical protein M0R39_17335, partial [Prolixibacteraceae bacterium]|nr:hypothetical protein [Prolixibacteraceae bacterium]